MKIEELKNIKFGQDYYFKGKKYYAVGWRGNMPLCTKEQYESFTLSDGHIYEDGVLTFGKKIGEIKDLQIKQ